MTGKPQKQFENGIVTDVKAETEALLKENNDAEVRRILQKKGILRNDLVSMSDEELSQALLIETYNLKLRKTASISAVLFNGKLILEVSNEGKKQKVIARNESGVLAMDVFNLSENSKRATFVENLKAHFTEAEIIDVLDELLTLASKLPELPKYNPKGETVQTSFKVLEDGRIIEQIRNGFAVYDSIDDSYSIEQEVTDANGITYKPIEDELFLKDGGIQLANELTEYGTEADLDADIEIYISTYLDLNPLQLKLTAKYIRFTYVFDKVLELSYLNPTGDPGSGKSRFGLTVCMAAHRGLSLITPSAASLYRIVDKFKPTLFIDEFNSNANSDDAAAIIQILNAGFQKTAQIPRQVATGDGNFKTEMFDAFCPKIIGSLKQSASNAFNSRCIEIQMERTIRNDIPLRLSQNLLNDAQRIRNKLTLWRLRNFNHDFEAKLDQAESELRKAGIMPRSIQISIPLFALIEDKKLKYEFKHLLKGRDEVLTAEKQRTIDGEIVCALHEILFDVEEVNGKEITKWKILRPLENQLCEELRAEKIVSMLNDSRKDRDHLNERNVGRKINSFGLNSKQIKKRASDYYNKSAIIFDSHRLAVIFNNYGLPIPLDVSLDQLDQPNKSNSDNSLEWSKKTSASNQIQPSLDHSKLNCNNNNSNWSNWSKENMGTDECPNCCVEYSRDSDGTPFCQFCFGKR
ncbi:MAG TPA: hypothetical protein VF556_03210 [Pyrinomonadaceae bacterium]|jgi:hypothetical protein